MYSILTQKMIWEPLNCDLFLEKVYLRHNENGRYISYKIVYLRILAYKTIGACYLKRYFFLYFNYSMCVIAGWQWVPEDTCIQLRLRSPTGSGIIEASLFILFTMLSSAKNHWRWSNIRNAHMFNIVYVQPDFIMVLSILKEFTIRFFDLPHVIVTMKCIFLFLPCWQLLCTYHL